MDHCREKNVIVSERPLVFAKFPNAVTEPYDIIDWDSTLTAQVDF